MVCNLSGKSVDDGASKREASIAAFPTNEESHANFQNHTPWLHFCGSRGQRESQKHTPRMHLDSDVMQPRKPDEPAQARLLRLIAAKDRDALGDFYDQVASALFATSARILGDVHEAEEVIQDVFVEIWNKASVFDDALGTAFHWVMSITRNRSIDRLRSRMRRAQMLDRFQEAVPSDPLHATPPPASALGTDELSGIRTAVKSLPPDQRLAVEMAFFNGQTHAEIAQKTGEPLGTVKARIRRGMLKLRTTLQEYA